MEKIKKIIYGCLLLISCVLPLPTEAVYLHSLIYEVDADKTFTALPVMNDTKRSNLYTLEAWKIRKPGNGNEEVITDAGKELLWSPLQFMTQPDGREYFKLYYRGPIDNTERYYRVLFRETPVSVLPWRNGSRELDIFPVVAMSTLLIVRPRNAKLKYEIDEANGTIRNTGNTFFRVILQKGCDGDDESSSQFYMLPGETWQGAEARKQNKKFIVAQGRYHQLGTGCFQH